MRFYERPGLTPYDQPPYGSPLWDEPLPAEWYSTARNRFPDQVSAWLLPTKLLSGSSTGHKFAHLALGLLKPTFGLPQLVRRVACGAGGRLSLAEALHQATIRTGSVIFANPNQLLSQVVRRACPRYGQCWAGIGPGTRARGATAARRWLRLLLGGSPSGVQTVITPRE